MSTNLTDNEARLLVDKMNYRSDLLAFVTKSRFNDLWFLLLCQMALALTLAYAWYKRTGNLRESIILLVGWAVWSVILHTYASSTHKRIDKLIQLLQQEGLLSTQLTNSEKTDSA